MSTNSESWITVDVILPNNNVTQITVARSCPMIDFLIQLTSKYNLRPSDHIVEAFVATDVRDLTPNTEKIPYQPNAQVGSLKSKIFKISNKRQRHSYIADTGATGLSHTDSFKSRVQSFNDLSKVSGGVPSSKRTTTMVRSRSNYITSTLPPQVNGEQTEQLFGSYRLQIHLPYSQLRVMRVKPSQLISEVIDIVCDESNLNINKYRVATLENIEVDCDKTFEEYKNITHIQLLRKDQTENEAGATLNRVSMPPPAIENGHIIGKGNMHVGSGKKFGGLTKTFKSLLDLRDDKKKVLSKKNSFHSNDALPHVAPAVQKSSVVEVKAPAPPKRKPPAPKPPSQNGKVPQNPNGTSTLPSSARSSIVPDDIKYRSPFTNKIMSASNIDLSTYDPEWRNTKESDLTRKHSSVDLSADTKMPQPVPRGHRTANKQKRAAPPPPPISSHHEPAIIEEPHTVEEKAIENKPLEVIYHTDVSSLEKPDVHIPAVIKEPDVTVRSKLEITDLTTPEILSENNLQHQTSVEKTNDFSPQLDVDKMQGTPQSHVEVEVDRKLASGVPRNHDVIPIPKDESSTHNLMTIPAKDDMSYEDYSTSLSNKIETTTSANIAVTKDDKKQDIIPEHSVKMRNNLQDTIDTIGASLQEKNTNSTKEESSMKCSNASLDVVDKISTESQEISIETPHPNVEYNDTVIIGSHNTNALNIESKKDVLKITESKPPYDNEAFSVDRGEVFRDSQANQISVKTEYKHSYSKQTKSFTVPRELNIFDSKSSNHDSDLKIVSGIEKDITPSILTHTNKTMPKIQRQHSEPADSFGLKFSADDLIKQKTRLSPVGTENQMQLLHFDFNEVKQKPLKKEIIKSTPVTGKPTADDLLSGMARLKHVKVQYKNILPHVCINDIMKTPHQPVSETPENPIENFTEYNDENRTSKNFEPLKPVIKPPISTKTSTLQNALENIAFKKEDADNALTKDTNNHKPIVKEIFRKPQAEQYAKPNFRINSLKDETHRDEYIMSVEQYSTFNDVFRQPAHRSNSVTLRYLDSINDQGNQEPSTRQHISKTRAQSMLIQNIDPQAHFQNISADKLKIESKQKEIDLRKYPDLSQKQLPTASPKPFSPNFTFTTWNDEKSHKVVTKIADDSTHGSTLTEPDLLVQPKKSNAEPKISFRNLQDNLKPSQKSVTILNQANSSSSDDHKPSIVDVIEKKPCSGQSKLVLESKFPSGNPSKSSWELVKDLESKLEEKRKHMTDVEQLSNDEGYEDKSPEESESESGSNSLLPLNVGNPLVISVFPYVVKMKPVNESASSNIANPDTVDADDPPLIEGQ